MTLPVWRFTRTRTARRLYDALSSIGLKVSVLDRFVRQLDGESDSWTMPPMVEMTATAAGARPDHWGIANPGLEDDHLVLAALEGETVVGEALLSTGGSVYVAELDRTIAFDGGYIWGVAVDREWRRAGIASALLSVAMNHLEDHDASTLQALVAPDNHPSRALFRQAGFTVQERHVYVNAFGFVHRSRGNGEGE